MTDKGRKYIENPPVPSVSPLEPTLEPTLGPTAKTKTPATATATPEGEITGTFPSQADQLRAEGQRLGVGSRRAKRAERNY